MSYVITETYKGQEIEVNRVDSRIEAYALFSEYTENDKEELTPCIYFETSEGELTTEF